VFGWDLHDQTYTKELGISNLRNGYKDILAKVDLSSYRRLPGTPSLPFFLVTFYDPDTQEGLYACPRATLQKVVDQLDREGYEAFAGAEVRDASFPLDYAPGESSRGRVDADYVMDMASQYEYFQFRETPKTIYEKDFHNLTPLSEGMHGYSLLRPELNKEYFHALYNNCKAFDIPIEGVCHLFSDPVRRAATSNVARY
jgi:glutamine synthetase